MLRPAAAAAAATAPPLPAVPEGRHLYNLLVYVDKDQYPQRMSVQVATLQELAAHIAQVIGQPVAAISVWDDEFRQYVPMASLLPLQRDMKGKLWVETGGVRIAAVTEAKDPLEWSALREHVDKLGPPRSGCVYEMVEAHKITNAALEDAFQRRRQRLIDPRARTMLLFYTNNARPSDQVVQHGFALPVGEQHYGGGIIFASDIDAQPALNSNLKFLLCEVAVGRPLTITDGDERPLSGGFDAAKYDSLLHITHRFNGVARLEEWAVYHQEQAVARYIITCSVVRGAMKPAWNPVAMGCDKHPGESLKLWCVNCRCLMCPYCLTIGAHKGHEGRDIAEVAGFEKQVLVKMFSTLDKTLVRRQGETAELERVRAMLNAAAKKGEEEIRAAMDELHDLLEAEERQLLSALGARREATVRDVERRLERVQQLCGEYQKKFSETKAFLELPVETSQQARMEFLAGLQSMLTRLQEAPTYDDPTATDVSEPRFSAHVAVDDARRGIQAIALTDAEGVGSMGGPSASGGGGVVPRAALESEIQRLRDVEAGYIWVIPNADKHFHPQQTADIFSDVFVLLGVEWELRLTSQPDEHISVFLHAANHTHRMDFKCVLISSRGWYVRNAKNWLESFKGKGWGIKPYADKKTILATYVNDRVLKLLITPTSGLY